MRIVDFHSHYASPEFPALAPVNSLPEHLERWKTIARRIADLESLVGELDTLGLTTRVLSAPPALVTPDGAVMSETTMRAMNDHLADAVAEHRGRLAGLATIDAFLGDTSANELIRATSELGLAGVVVDCARGELLLGAPESRSLLEAAAAAGVAVFAHPVSPARLSAELQPLGNFGRSLARGTASAASLFSLITTGTLDEVPGLQVVFAWLGGGALPVAATVAGSERLRRDTPPEQRWHVYFDTMGFEPNAIRYAVGLLGADHVLCGSDWPIGLAVASSEKLDEALAATGLDEMEQALVASENAVNLLRLDKD